MQSIAIPNTDKLFSIHDGSEIKGVIISIKGGGNDSEGTPYDFISRYFAPWNGIPEDPVTGKDEINIVGIIKTAASYHYH